MTNTELDDPRVAALVGEIGQSDGYESAFARRVLTVLEKLHPPTPGTMLLLRGVNAGSPAFAEAERGFAATHSGYVADDYKQLALPEASYWCDRALPVRCVLDPLGHAFGGDHAAPWETAKRGLVLVRCFPLKEGPPRADMLVMDGSEPAAWKCSAVRDERLVFGRVQCRRYPPLLLVRMVVRDELKADLLCKAMYVRYLIGEAGYRNDPKALALLPSYADPRSLCLR